MRSVRKQRKKRKKLFNLKSIDGRIKFKLLTSKPGILSDIFKNYTEDIESLTKKFFERLNGVLHKCFKKIRVTDKENIALTKLLDKRRVLRTKADNKSKPELCKIDEKLAELCAEDNFRKIKDEVRGLESEKGGLNAGRLWKLKKRLSPRVQDPPTAMMNEAGSLVTSAAGIKKLAMDHYKKVLENRPMKEDLMFSYLLGSRERMQRFLLEFYFSLGVTRIHTVPGSIRVKSK